ncbi:MAG TPA: MBL fold metallo-hydrolase [Patescibacteria group bacterium]|nr:MBL fold metallo-hydrolase [Patescibacteria group bacterium]
MVLNWYGLTTFRLQENGLAMLFDPADEKSGLKIPRMQNDITLFSHPSGFRKDSSFVINSPGEYEIKGAFIYGIPTNGEVGTDKIIYLIEINGVRLAHLGSLKQSKLSPGQLEKLEGVDILLLPVGGGEALTAKQATEVISQLEPRVVVPMNYKTPGVKVKLDGLEAFKKEIGVKFESVDKLKISQKDLPEEETRFVVIEPSQ